MSKTDLIHTLEQYVPFDELESQHQSNMLEFIRKEAHCFERQNLKGHMTASALILDQERTQVLMMHHAKLNMWLQPGGHADGDTDLLQVALKEAHEETGLQEFKVLSNEIFDLDMHSIPMHKEVTAHHHLDVRFLLETNANIPLVSNHESNQLAWIPLQKMAQFNSDESVLRMVRKALQM